MSSTPAPMRYIERAMSVLRDMGLELQPTQNAATQLIMQLESLDEGRVRAIAATLAQSSSFNELVRREIQVTSIGRRYEEIAQHFDSVRDDAKRMLTQLDDGKIGFTDKAANLWMRLQRGSITSRFKKIKTTFNELSQDTQKQLEQWSKILGAYLDFRYALKEAEILASELLKKSEDALNQTQLSLEQAADDLAAHSGERADQARLELKRDEAIRQVQLADEKYQIAKDLAENLLISYNTSEAVMARINQISDTQKRVYQQSVSFFATNETVFTALSAAFSAEQGLHESTQGLEAMKAGINKGLESISETGDKQLEAGLKAGYGPTLQAESVKKLVDAVVGFQERQIQAVQELRALASANAKEIEAAVEAGKTRHQMLLQQTARAQTKSLSTQEPL